LRYVRHAVSLGRPVVIVNQGATRGDALASVRLDAPLGETLTAVAGQIGVTAGSSALPSLHTAVSGRQ
jgi:hypothetical protein